jgi:hypothetical protein
MVTLVSAPGLLVFLVARSSFFTWATASIKPLNKRAANRIRFISDVVPFLWGVYNSPGAPLLAFEKWHADNQSLGGDSIAGHPSAMAQGRLSQKA